MSKMIGANISKMYNDLMHSILVIIHISSMMASIALMTTALFLGLRGQVKAANTATGGMIATLLGSASGAILLMMTPATAECIILTAYLVFVTVLYNFGFGMGYAEKARLIRS